MSAVASAQVRGNWQSLADGSAAGGSGLWNPDGGAAKVAPALASPTNYFEASFNANPGTAYHVWVRMRAQNNSLSNDSVHIQFDDALTMGGSAFARVGTTGSMEFVLQDGPSGAADHGWGWTENGWGSLGPNIQFATSGPHTLRVQQREDGPIVDQIVISPDTYLTSSPGARRDDTTILPSNGGIDQPPQSAAGTVVLWPSDAPAAAVHGSWAALADSSAAGGGPRSGTRTRMPRRSCRRSRARPPIST
jgi:hypothetical protein